MFGGSAERWEEDSEVYVAFGEASKITDIRVLRVDRKVAEAPRRYEQRISTDSVK